MTGDDINRLEAEIDSWRQRYMALLHALADQQSLAPPRMLSDKESYELGRLHGSAAELRRRPSAQGERHMSKHTPGPWQYAFEGGTTAFITEADGSTIICIRTTENTTAHKNLAANARLIAAAPDLLDVTQDFRHKLATYVSVYPGDKELRRLLDECDAAIAKATGGAA